ncbi:hypothetical protein BHM03_00025055 [Ensete ventricosum]|nr:hypothetical protein BHM03_00025055 [Ensete ventricosum]
MGSRTSTVSQKNVMVINFMRSHAQIRVSIGFSCTVSEIQNTSRSRNITHANPNVLAHGKSYEHGFKKNATVINITRSCAQSQVSIGFTCTISEIQNTGHSRRISP